MKRLFYLLMLLCVSAHAQTDPSVRKKEFNIDNGTALQGYDAVSYFSGKPLKGNKKFTAVYQGINYHFANEQNAEAFKKAPLKYEPAYGGWCAFAMGDSGDKVDFDPHTFKIKDGKLFVFYNKFFNNTLDKWNKDEPNLKKKADANWIKIVK